MTREKTNIGPYKLLYEQSFTTNGECKSLNGVMAFTANGWNFDQLTARDGYKDYSSSLCN